MLMTANHNGHNRGRPRALDRRRLPHATDAEASILGGIILRNDVLGELPELEVDDFFDFRHKVVFRAMRTLEVASTPIDVVTLENQIEKAGELDAVGGIAFLGELVLKVPTVDNVHAYAELVRRHRRNRDAMVAIGSALERAYAWPHDPDELVSELAGELARHVPQQRAHDSTFEWMPPLEAFLGEKEPTDADAEDWVIRDIIPRGEPFLFGGAWKSGKTWTAIALACCIALGRPFLGFENTLGRPGRVLLLALEDGRRRLCKRVWQVLRGLGVTPNDPIVRAHLRVWDRPIRMPGDARAVARFAEEIKRWAADVVIVDSLTKVMVGSQNDIRDASAFTDAWRDVIVKSGAALGFLHHTNKSKPQDARHGEQDPFDNLRGSGELLAAPRNLVVMERFGDKESKTSCVYVRGNLDLRRSSFALEYTQEEVDGKTVVTLHDRGDVDDLKLSHAKRKDAAAEIERVKKLDKRTTVALKIARDRGACSSSTLAVVEGVSESTAARCLRQLAQDGLLAPVTTTGYPLTSAGHSWLEERKVQ